MAAVVLRRAVAVVVIAARSGEVAAVLLAQPRLQVVGVAADEDAVVLRAHPVVLLA